MGRYQALLLSHLTNTPKLKARESTEHFLDRYTSSKQLHMHRKHQKQLINVYLGAFLWNKEQISKTS